MLTPEAIEKLAASQATAAANEALLNAATTDQAVVALPNNFNLHDLEKFLPLRRRARGAMATMNLKAFADYVEQHSEAGSTVFVDQDSMTATAVLDLGGPGAPGHADNRAKLTLKKTAAYLALQAHTLHGKQLTQREAAEFLEDWAALVKCLKGEAEIEAAAAAAAMRDITIEALKKGQNTEEQLSVSRSTFDKVTASSEKPIPSAINFKCAPYHGLADRVFVLRLAIIVGEKAPTITLRVVMQEQHAEEMASEFAAKVSEAATGVQVLIGSYQATA